MGMMEYYCRREPDEQILQRKKQIEYFNWKQGDGTVINITKMSLSHLENAIAKIKRDDWRKEWLPYLETELESRTHR